MQSLLRLEHVLRVAGVRHRSPARPGPGRLAGAATLAVALVAACAFGVASTAATPQASASRSYAALLAPAGTCAGDASLDLDAAAARSAMLCLVNYARVRSGLPPLRLLATLNLAGQAKLQADLTCDQFSHYPCGHSLESVFARYLAGSSSYCIGENLAWGTGDEGTPRQTLSNWLNSPEHRANLLTPQFRDLGVGYLANQSFQGLQDATLWSQEFGTAGRALEGVGTPRR